MQKLPVYLYANLFEVMLDLDNNIGIHQTMYQRALTIQKGVRNTVQLQFKNSDQKRLNISTQTFVVNIFDPETNTLTLTKPVQILDNASTTTNALKGIGQVTFNEVDLIDVPSKTYRFSVTRLENDRSYSPAYTNTYYGASGTLEVKDDIYPVLQPSLEIKNFQANFNGTTGLWEYSTGNLRASPEFQAGTALQTVVYYMSNFRGTVLIEGTLDNSPSYYGYYAPLATKTYTGFTGPDYVNFNGIFSYVRVRFIPTASPITSHNNDTTYAGSLDRVQYRS